ncbi:MAG: hypothetical protein ABUL73_04630 [Alphaproteobacteria bacterium]
MKTKLVSAVALAFALGQFAAVASAEPAQPAASHFRTASPQSFTAADLQRYGLSSEDAAKVSDMQAHGYRVQVVSPQDAQRYHAGAWGNHTWWIVGGIIVVVAIAVAASN